ncbi:hypothetical protein [Streptomyces sp. NPDC003717]|uniref:hypothetical protein n=1 Tax=Streptomyces sp. NPDC003717 TaxID=3154276 RepID=UPI0033B1ED45
MDASVSALVVAVVGVCGTLLSGILVHRGAIRSKALELDHAERQRREDRLVAAGRESAAERKAAYREFNQRLRQFHQVLWNDHLALGTGQAAPDRTRERDEPRHALRDVYAEVQIVVPDQVLAAGGGLVHRLNHIHRLLAQHEQGTAADETPDQIKERLLSASEALYEVRQTMRRDLGVSDLPVERPEGYGAD